MDSIHKLNILTNSQPELLADEYSREYKEEVLPDLPISQYGNLESFVLYAMIRAFKLTNIVEIGTERQGRSSYLIQKALLKNGSTFYHTMCDFTEVIETAKETMFDTTNTFFLAGDIRDTWEQIYLPDVDFLFIDAHHARDFAVWYLNTLIPKLRKNTLIHIHDINLSGDWKWRATWDSEAEEIILQHFAGIIPIKKELWLEDWCLNPEYEVKWNNIKKKLLCIGKFGARELPYSCSATYWRKKYV